jgi:nitroreductase
MSVWESIASLARLAPTPHNTQPFRILPRDERSADLVAMTERFLPREDHGNLYVGSAFGIFAATVERAACQFGYSATVIPVDDVDPAALTGRGPRVVLGRVNITGTTEPEPQFPLLDARRTSRLPYHDRTIDPATLSMFGRTVATRGHRFIEYADPAIVKPLLRLNAEAVVDNLQLDDEREEIRGWYRMGKTPEFGDGLWQAPMNQPAWELRAAFIAPSLFRLPGLRHFAIHRYLLTQRGTRHVALICGRFRAWPELYTAGRVLFDLWLEMARAGVYMQPMGSMLTNPVYSAEIARRFGVDDCWLVLRLGYSDPPPRAPRLESILLSA